MLVDIQHVAGLKGSPVDGGWIVVGAMVRHREFERDPAVHAVNPLVREVMANVAHVPIRNRGTVVGSLCHGDAAAEMPLLLILCNGTVVCAGRGGRREIAAEDFFQFHLSTARLPEELAVEARFCTLPAGTGYAFEEFTRRHGDYAIASVGCLINCGGDGRVENIRLVAGGIGSRPMRLTAAEARLKGQLPTAAAVHAAAEIARAAVTAEDDFHASRQYRQRLLAALVRRTVVRANGRTATAAIAA